MRLRIELFVIGPPSYKLRRLNLALISDCYEGS